MAETGNRTTNSAGKCRVSVILPVYNSERFLKDAADSVLGQTFDDLELLIFDDGSKDSSIAMLKQYEARDQRVRVFLRDHCGYTPHLNEGLWLAKGDLVARMDSDDICLPERFASQVKFLDSHPEVVAVGSSTIHMDEWGDPFTQVRVPTDHDEIDRRHLSGSGGAMPHPSVMMRRQAVLAVNGYRPQFEPAEDLDLWLRLAETGQLANIAEPLLRYRIHDRSVSRDRAKTQQERLRLILEETFRRRRLNRVTDSVANPEASDAIDPYENRMHKALYNGYPATAAKYAARLLRQHPASLSRWRDFCVACYATFRSR